MTANIISLLGLSQGILLGTVLLLAHRRDRPTYLLGLFVFTLALRVIPFLLIRTPYGAAHPGVLYLPLYFWFIGVPLVYLYCRQLTGILRWRKDVIHLIPGAVEFAVLKTLFLLEVNRDAPLFSPELQRGIIGTYTLVAIGPATYYVYLTLRLLERHRGQLPAYSSDPTDHSLDWIRNALFSLIGFALAYTLMVYGPLPVNPSVRITFGAVVNTLIIYYIAVHGLRQVKAKALTNNEPEETGNHLLAFRELEHYLTTNEAFLDPNLTLYDLGQRVHQSERNLSRIINAGSGQNFNSYINHFRVLAAAKMLSDPNYDRFTMDGIATKAGFNNKSTFYQVFKRENGISPAAYRRQR